MANKVGNTEYFLQIKRPDKVISPKCQMLFRELRIDKLMCFSRYRENEVQVPFKQAKFDLLIGCDPSLLDGLIDASSMCLFDAWLCAVFNFPFCNQS